jgi:acyl carrier protein
MIQQLTQEQRVLITHKIKEYIKDASLGNTESITDDLLIFESGLLDSMGLLFLIEFLKEEFGVEVKDEELVVENFESIQNIVAFVEQKL